jgi:hypothetical protein
MAVQSAAVGAVSPGGSFTVGALGFSDDGDRGALAGIALVRARDFRRPAAVAPRQPEPYLNPHQPKDAHRGERTTCSRSGT